MDSIIGKELRVIGKGKQIVFSLRALLEFHYQGNKITGFIWIEVITISPVWRNVTTIHAF
jgi:hypothetical protein